jgi:tetratricopeptide (TPR) repeat protein
MAPEQIEELISREHGKVDVRTDLFALGAVAFELLTCEPAFPTNWISRSEFPRYLEVRRGAVPSPRAANPAVSPAADAVVRKLLAPDPARRYRTAEELRTDLDRHLADLPLASAPDRSIRERFGKWRRRNPWLPLYLAMAAVVGLVIGLGVSIYGRDAAARTAAAVARAETLRARLPALRMDLTVPGDAAVRARGRAAAEEHLAPFGLPADPRWQRRAAFARTPDPLRPAVAADLGEVLLLLAHARKLDRLSAPEPERAALLDEARQLNGLARDCFDPDAVPPFLCAQRAELAALAGEPDGGPPAGDAKHPRDHYLEAVGLIGGRNFRAAVGPLERAIAGEPGHAAAHFALAACRHQLRQYTRALERYDTAQAMLPGDPRPPFNRGLVFGVQGKVAAAEAEFALALALDPRHGESYLKRAGVRRQQKKYRAAEEDLTRALECGVSALQVYSLRAQVRALLGDRDGAESDRRAAGAVTPETEADFVYRGRSRLPGDPKGALADFEAAAALNPYSLAAVQSQAHVWSELLRDDRPALAHLSAAAAFAPEDAGVRAGRAVLLARVGKRDDARLEAEIALALSDDPTITYQIAGVYALSAALDPADADRAFALLRQAVRDGFRDADTIDADPDLHPIRQRPGFAEISKSVRVMNR